jgi:hypothetical protein
MTFETEGRVEYGARAFEQDASLAIRGDVIRALIELVTNADDAYGAKDGDIWIRITPWDEDDGLTTRIDVQDSARGLTAEGLKNAFAVLGGKRADDDGAVEARGLLGRGAKDVASLGRVVFSAIRDGKYSQLSLESTGVWKLTAVDEPATPEQFQELALEPGESGLTASLFIAGKFTVPTRNRLLDKLTRHAQLRDLITRRPVFVQDSRGAGVTTRLEGHPAAGEIVIDTDVELDGYEPVHLTVRRLPQRASGQVNEFSDHGLLVRSGVTTFQNTWFELDPRPESAYFAGYVNAPQIAPIIRAYDDGEAIGGPMRLLSRDRDGLVKNHPYRKELARAVTREVQPLFDALSKQMDAGKKQGEQLSRAFKVASEALKDQLNAALEEIEDEDTGGGNDPDPTAVLTVIPPRLILAPGGTATLSVRCTDKPVQGLHVAIEHQTSDDVLASAAASEDGWSPHKRLDVVVSHVYLDAGLADGTATILVEAGGHSARAQVVVAQPQPGSEQPPTSLEFTTAKATISPTRGRRLELRAPVDQVGENVNVWFEGSGLSQVPAAVTLGAEPGGRWAQASVRCVAGQEPGSGVIYARLEDDEATCEISVAERPGGIGGLGLAFELNGHRSPNRRIGLMTEPGRIEIQVYANHPTYNGVFGTYDEEASKFSNEDSAQARAILAEVVAAELAAYLTERDYARRPEQLNDAPRVLVRRAEFANRFVGILHRALAPSS